MQTSSLKDIIFSNYRSYFEREELGDNLGKEDFKLMQLRVGARNVTYRLDVGEKKYFLKRTRSYGNTSLKPESLTLEALKDFNFLPNLITWVVNDDYQLEMMIEEYIGDYKLGQLRENMPFIKKIDNPKEENSILRRIADIVVELYNEGQKQIHNGKFEKRNDDPLYCYFSTIDDFSTFQEEKKGPFSRIKKEKPNWLNGGIKKYPIEKIDGVFSLSELEKRFRSHAQQHYSESDKISPKEKNISLIHPDPILKNWLDVDEKTYLVDWDGTYTRGIGAYLGDVAYFIAHIVTDFEFKNSLLPDKEKKIQYLDQFVLYLQEKLQIPDLKKQVELYKPYHHFDNLVWYMTKYDLKRKSDADINETEKNYFNTVNIFLDSIEASKKYFKGKK